MSNDPEMQLPEGKTCADCAFEKQCCRMYGAKPENTWCDFHPVRFVASNKTVIAALTKTNADLLEALKGVVRNSEMACVQLPSAGAGLKPPTKDVYQFPRWFMKDIEDLIAATEVTT